MSSVETTELKLKTTPTGGLEAHTSPYYRRLLSAGYKGFLQGSIGGASLYGFMGLVVGGLAAVILGPIGIISTTAAWLLIPAAVGFGVFKGATTFGNIGSVAAINAESADLSEQRRYLLDRYYDLPEGPEGDKEAAAIRQELLARQKDPENKPHLFHWKTVFIGMAIGVTLALCGLAASGIFAGGAITIPAVEGFFHTIGFPLASKLSAELLSATALASAGGVVGGLAGATIGLDRYYIRKWFDHTQDVVHSSSHTEGALMERAQQVERLKTAHKEDEKTQMNEAASLADAAIAKASQSSAAAIAASKSEPQMQTTTIAPLTDKPTTQIQASAATHERRLAEIKQLIEV